MKRAIGSDSIGDTGGSGEEAQEEKHQRVPDQMEGFTH
jgi:hypothetical protein